MKFVKVDRNKYDGKNREFAIPLSHAIKTNNSARKRAGKGFGCSTNIDAILEFLGRYHA